MYQLLRSALFLLDAEKAHYTAMNALSFACKIPLVSSLIKKMYQPARQSRYHLPGTSLQFPNRIGLAAGFDKNAIYLKELALLGFGFIEVGTVTPLPQAGNPKPRLFRLKKDGALINRMGFNNDGVAAVASRLQQWRSKAPHPLIIGGNIGKNKITPNEDAWKDYLICLEALHPFVDYFVVNVSSPNTPGLRALQEKDALEKILTTLQQRNQQLASNTQPSKPIFLKIAPDLEKEQLDEVIELALAIQLDGLVATNTTLDRSGLQTSAAELEQIGAGGLSGLPVKTKSTRMVQYIHQQTQGKIPLIASGGIFTGADAQEKLNAGASLVQVWTGFIYEGPGIVKNIHRVIG